MHVVDRSLFLAISRLLWAFEITKARDENGGEVTPDRMAMDDSQVATPSPFLVSIRPRSELKAAVVREAWRECQALLDEDKQWKEVPEGIGSGTWES